MEPQNSYVENAPLSEMQSPRKSPVSRATETLQAIMPAATTATILGMPRGRAFFILLVVLVLGFVAVKLRPYISYISSLVELIRTLFGSAVDLTASTTTGIVDNTAKGTDVIVDKLSGSSKKQLRLPEPDAPSADAKNKSTSAAWTADIKTPRGIEVAVKKTESPEPDDTTSAVQTKSGYCYVGEWKGVRSCVKVSGGCTSGKVFTTESSCTKRDTAVE